MKKIIIFRHGDYNHNSGQLDVESAMEIFARTKMIRQQTGCAAVIYASPILRCQQTAQVIALAMDNAKIETEGLLAESFHDAQYQCKNKLIELAKNQDSDTIAVVTHYPNIKLMFNASLRPGMEITFEAENWQQIFDKAGSNFISRTPGFSEELFERYFAPECEEGDAEKLQTLDFLKGRL